MPRVPGKKKARARRPAKKPRGIDGLVRNRKPTLGDIKKIMVTVNKMVVPAKNLSEARAAYNTPPEKLVKDGRIPVIFGKDGVANYGCYQLCGVMYRALERLGLEPKLSRQLHGTQPHTRVFFTLKGEMYEIEMFFNLSINKVDKELLGKMKEAMEKGAFRFIEPGSISYKQFKNQKRIGKI